MRSVRMICGALIGGSLGLGVGVALALAHRGPVFVIGSVALSPVLSVIGLGVVAGVVWGACKA